MIDQNHKRMQISLPVVKVLKTAFENLIFKQEWCSMLSNGDFYAFENLLHQALFGLYDGICEQLINFVSTTDEFIAAQKEKALEQGLKKLSARIANVRLRTGTRINYVSFICNKVT